MYKGRLRYGEVVSDFSAILREPDRNHDYARGTFRCVNLTNRARYKISTANIKDGLPESTS